MFKFYLKCSGSRGGDVRHSVECGIEGELKQDENRRNTNLLVVLAYLFWE